MGNAWFDDGHHPLWSCLRLGIVLTVLVVASMLTATNFDETELKLIAAVAVGAAGSELLAPIFRKVTK